MRFTSLTLGSLLVLALPACAGQVLDVDTTATGGTSGGGDGEGVTYVGYATNHPFAGADHIVLGLSSVGEGNVTGTLVLGNGTPPPIDPTKIYPPGSYPSLDWGPQAIEGFTYTLVDAAFEGKRLRFAVALAEAYTDWCTAQSSYAWPDGSFHTTEYYESALICGEGEPGVCYYEEHPDVIISLEFWAMTDSNVCVCDVNGCGPNPTGDLRFDLRLEDDGTELNGTDLYSSNVFLTRP